MHNEQAINSPKTVRRWFNAHVEAKLLHAAIECQVLESLLNQPLTSIELADLQGYNPRGVRVLLEGLAGLGLVFRDNEGRYFLKQEYQAPFDPNSSSFIGPVVDEAQQHWDEAAGATTDIYNFLVNEAEAAVYKAHPDNAYLVRCAWSYVWTAALIQLAASGVFTALDEQPYSHGELAQQIGLTETDLSPLLLAGQKCAVLKIAGDEVTLTESARFAFGKGMIKGYTRWIEQRLQMDRHYFWRPLGSLANCVRSGESFSKISTPGNDSSLFRRTFIRVNRPLIPLLYHFARKVAQAINAFEHPLHVLEVGPGLGIWGIAIASSHTRSSIEAVDIEDALAETRSIVAAVGLTDRYIWHPGNLLEIDFPYRQYDVIILNEICHTIPPSQLLDWLARVVRSLKSDGLLLIADMILEKELTGPLRYLLASIKLLVSGGGQLMSADGYREQTGRVGLPFVQFYRLPTSDLILAHAKDIFGNMNFVHNAEGVLED